MHMLKKGCETPYGVIRYWICRAGENRPWLVFLPGLTADHRLFDGQVAELGKEYNCLVWDAPGHGTSRPFALKFSMEDLARYLRQIFTAEGIAGPVLVGQSLGGYIAQVYMEAYPGSVSGFISIDSCPLQRRYYTGLELALLKHTKGMYLSIPWRWLLRWGAAGCAVTEYGQKLMAQMMGEYNKREYCTLADHGYRIFAQAVEAGKAYAISCPVLLLCGERDRAGSAKRYNREWARRSGYPLVWVPGAGHNANTDRIDFVNGQIGEFVQGLWDA